MDDVQVRAADGVDAVLAAGEVQPLDRPPGPDLDGDVAEIANRHGDDLAESERDDREVVAPHAQGRRADRDAEERRDRGRDPDAHPEAPCVPVERRAEDRRVQEPHAVGSDREERGVAEVEEARVADHDVETEREEHVDHPVGHGVNGLEPQDPVDERVRDQGRHERRPSERAARGDRHPAHHFSGGRSPMRPWGRKTRTRMRIAKTIALVQRAEMYWSLHADRNPMKNPPSAAPGMLPMPPSTAAVKARRPAWYPIHHWPML